MKFTIHNSVDEQFYFNLKDADGRKLLTSRDFRTLTDCSNAIYRMQQYKDFLLEDELPLRFSLQTTSGNVIAKSAMYASAFQMRIDKKLISSDLVKACVEDHSFSVRFFRPVARQKKH
ncbi:MAG: DUF1508 domain-containing protein [Chitinophagaceae bacterium]|nr:DUF1508 domain-containing protein [Chitinophagaceae bacterium]